MTTTDELRRALGPVWIPGVNAAENLAALEPMLAETGKLVVATGIASVWTWPAAELAAAADRLEASYPGRFILGLGVSHAPLVESTGQAYVRPLAKMRQFLDELPAALAPGADGQAAAREYAKYYLRLPNYTSNLRRFGFGDEDIAGTGSDRLVSAIVPNGPEMTRIRLREHLDAGADHVLLQPIGPGGRFAAGDIGELASLVAGLPL